VWEPEKQIRPELLQSQGWESGRKKRVAAFCSHGGSNFAAIADAAQQGEIPVDVVVMIHNNAKAGAKGKAQTRNIPTEWVPRKRFESDEAYAEHLLSILRRYEVDIVALAGFMQMIPPKVIRAFESRITNIHPALLPFFGGKGFYGSRVHRAVYESGMKVSGPTVHLVDEEYDHGPILLQQAVSIAECKDPGEIADKVLIEEHKLYPVTLGLLALGRFRIEEGKAQLLSETEPA